MTFQDLLEAPPYSLAGSEKKSVLLETLNGLTRHHRARCAAYDRILSVLYPGEREAGALSDIPYLPVGLFKSHRLLSIPENEVFKTMTSSGTTGQQVSQIFLDVETAKRQTAALSRVLTHVLGGERLPMILVESAALLKDRKRFSARAAGVLGMMNFGRQHFYALDDEMRLDLSGLVGFLQRFGKRPFFVFGFTFMVWQYFLLPLADAGVDLSQAILIHSGGWKKLEEMAVDNDEFKRRFREITGLTRIYNFYGMVEQVGSVYLEGEDGFLYAPNFADVIIRDPLTLRENPSGRPGLIQVLSVLPLSYPGHSLLTEDLGVVEGVDDGRCGRKGKYFRILGRVRSSELRGCSDTHAAEVTA